MRSFPVVGLAVFALCAAIISPSAASAYFAGGGRDASKGDDCLIGYEGIDAGQITVDGKKNIFACTDCDPNCDHDGVTTANGTCTIAVRVCINQSGVEGCMPSSALDKASARGKVKGVKGADGRVAIDTAEILQGSQCSSFMPVVVPVKDTKQGPTDGKFSFNLMGSIKKNKAQGVVARQDKDKLTYLCVPRPADEACPIPTTTTTGASSTSTSTSASSTTSTTLQSGCFQDWGDGTIRDTCTGLQWEKKTTTVGSGVNPGALHDVDNSYSWAGECSVTTSKQCQPSLAAETACKAQTAPAYWANSCEQCVGGEGTCKVDPRGMGAITTAWQWLSQVNAANYAGHDDWRLPSEDGRNTSPTTNPRELETILLAPWPCATNPCIASIFGPTTSIGYWSSSTIGNTTVAWYAEFGAGMVGGVGKSTVNDVRAVRGGS